MKRLLLLFLAAIFLGTALIYGAAELPSYLLISVGHWSLETSVWFAAAALLTACAIALLVWKLLHGSTRSVRRQVGRMFGLGEVRAQRDMAAGLVSFIEGNWRQALKMLTRSSAKSPAPILNYLAAARCAHELGDEQQANEWLAKAEQEDHSPELAIALSQARIQLRGRKYEACVATLERARKKASNHPMVLDLLCQAYQHLNDWQALESLLPMLRKHKVIATDTLDELELTSFSKQLEQLGSDQKQTEEARRDTIRALWKRVPKNLRSDPDLLRIYLQQLMSAGQDDEAEPLIRKALQHQWDDGLALHYGLLQGQGAERRLRHAEGWLQQHPASSQLLLTLGRLSMRSQLWGKARDYYGESIRVQPSPEACAELGQLLQNLGEKEASMGYYRQGLSLTVAALPELPQP